MNKPMYCPMSFANASLAERYEYNSFGDTKTISHPMECTPDCGWAIMNETQDYHACSIAVIGANLANKERIVAGINWRPIEDDRK